MADEKGHSSNLIFKGRIQGTIAEVKGCIKDFNRWELYRVLPPPYNHISISECGDETIILVLIAEAWRVGKDGKRELGESVDFGRVEITPLGNSITVRAICGLTPHFYWAWDYFINLGKELGFEIDTVTGVNDEDTRWNRWRKEADPTWLKIVDGFIKGDRVVKLSKFGRSEQTINQRMCDLRKEYPHKIPNRRGGKVGGEDIYT